jgi:dipeptidyl aminopeptidase/acylaminoacyl peptidase
MRHFACAAILALLPSLAVAQEKTVAVPPGIRVEGMPPIPQSIEDGLARYAQFREAQMLAWHPTKRQILIQTAFGNFPQIHLVDGPGHARTQLTFLPQPGVSRLVSAQFDPADGNTFVFQRDPAGGEARSLYRYDLSTGEVSLVVDAKSRFSAVWARQGKWLAYDSTERNGKDRDLYVVQPSDPKTKRRIAEVEGPWSPQDWSPDGTTLLANEIFSNSETYLWRVDVKTGEKKALTPRDGEKAIWYFARFSADGKKVYAISDKGGDLPRVWCADIATGKWTAVTGETDGVDIINGFELSSDGQMMAVVVDRGAISELRVIDLGTLKARPLPALPKGVIRQVRWRPRSREVAFSVESIRTQGDVYSIDTSLSTLSRWTTSEVSFNPETALPPPELVEWKSADGVTISGILYRPAAKFTGPRPVMINLHGGPDLREQMLFRGRSNFFLNELGVAILYPNVRGSIGFGRKFEQMDNGRGRDGAIKDVGAALDWIATRPDLDKTRVVLTGASYGGWLALEAGIVYNDRIRGIMEGAGMTDLPTYLEQTEPARQENRRREFGDERDPQTREYLRSISPVTRAADLKKPTLIMHPGKDTRVPVSQAQELVKALKANNATVWYLEFSDANHDNFPGTRANNDYVLYSWIMFFKTFVLN